jgi:hypothetical protein
MAGNMPESYKGLGHFYYFHKTFFKSTRQKIWRVRIKIVFQQDTDQKFSNGSGSGFFDRSGLVVFQGRIKNGCSSDSVIGFSKGNSVVSQQDTD